MRGWWWVSFVAAGVVAIAAGDNPLVERDPAVWGGDHVGKGFPEYVTGDECLFCHRKIGPAWPGNRHQLTIRPATPDDAAMKALLQLDGGKELAGETKYLMGSGRMTRFLKRSEEYGKLELLSAAFVPGESPAGTLRGVDSMAWDAKAFGDRCAGCHATAVDTKTKAFAALSLDCVVCHGDVPLGHTKDTSEVLLSAKSREPRVVVSICGQCHLRGGKSKSSGRGYANTFVAGDNLLRDFAVDLSEKGIEGLPVMERHVYLSARGVAILNREADNCLSCHDVHRQSTDKHQQLGSAEICASCHVFESGRAKRRDDLLPANRLKAHSRVCEY